MSESQRRREVHAEIWIELIQRLARVHPGRLITLWKSPISFVHVGRASILEPVWIFKSQHPGVGRIHRGVKHVNTPGPTLWSVGVSTQTAVDTLS